MNDGDDIPESVRKCLDVLDKNLEILTNLGRELDDEKENEFAPNMKLHDLYDVTQDVAESVKLKNAESSFMRRHVDRNNDSSDL
ncbi:hypothetical protein [Nitrosopumilus sp.]|uniref:hypothetical protein n=1 Tax=Nitrosopumilus sp. TaxID=2024843 RepID=UPI00292F2381|nr:hypothetical protein [Nitrosopumilus sp.]